MAKDSEATKEAGKKRRAGRGPAWTFPKHTLEDALRVARSIEDKNAGKPMRSADLAKAVGFNKSNDWRYRELLRSANQYGLVDGSTATGNVSLAKTGEDVVAPSSSKQRQDALVKAFHHVELFKKVQDFYSGKRIPEDEFFENTLVREFSVPRDRLRIFIDVFTANLKFLKLFTPTRRSEDREVGDGKGTDEAPLPKDEDVREFLDSCFVMMPFGGWFDRYYSEIYVPSIKAAGFEPMRSDELFTTGTVVEQIWEQIEKATVLLADLSNKNANVFYELGLAHAARKPVVLTANSIDDVPFDLRHLRVITYDVNEPKWSDKLSKSVVDYLKNAKKEPERSIPQPFRELARLEGSAEEDPDSDDEPDAQHAG